MKAVAENATAFYVCDSQERWRFVKTMLQNIKTNCAFFAKTMDIYYFRNVSRDRKQETMLF